MKVVISNSAVYPFHPYGGVEKYFYYLAKYLVKEGIDVEVVTSAAGSKRSEVVDGIKYTFISPSVDLNRPLLSLPLLHLFGMNLARYLRNKDFDILHSYDLTPYYYCRLQKRAPVIFTPFLLYRGCSPKDLKGVKRILVMGLGRYFFKRPLIRYLLNHADAIASEGDFQTDEIIELFGLDREKFFTLPPGVDISHIREDLKKKGISRADLGLDDNLVFITVNRLEPVKGVNYLVDAFNLIKQRLEKSTLILIGTGNEEKRIKEQINKYGLTDSVMHLKNISEKELYNYYALSDIYISPVLQTDFIMGIEEAMACGLPVISTGQPWLVKPGVNGFIVPPGNPQMMADAALEMHEKNMTRRMGVKSGEIVQEFDWKTIARKAIGVYEEVISRRKSSGSRKVN